MNNKIIQFNTNYSERLDKLIFNDLKIYSRSLIKKWILNKQVQVNNFFINKPSKKFKGKIRINIRSIENKKNIIYIPQNIKLKIVYEDYDIMVIDKQNNIVVHPGAGHDKNTLLNGIIYHNPNNIHLPRGGIVHRLDKNTTGLMVVAKNLYSYFFLIDCMKKHKITRKYKAIVDGEIKKNGLINKPIMRNINHRTRMMVHNQGKIAITKYKIIKKFNNFTYISVQLKTGRTHQIRVHMSFLKHKILGDKTYGKTKTNNIKLNNILISMNRQALHACELNLIHPTKNNRIKFYSSIPKDMLSLIKFLNKYYSCKNI